MSMRRLAALLFLMLCLPVQAWSQITASDAQLRFRETDQSLPAGLWRLRLNGDTFTIEQNTDATGAYGTIVTPVSIASGGVVTFLYAPVFSSLTASRLVSTTAGKALTSFADGTSGQVLRSAGAALPAWSTATYPGTATGTGTVLRADGTNWAASTSTLADTYAQGSIVYAGTANTLSGLAVGSSGQILTNNGTVPGWTTATYPGTATGTGTILRANGTNWVASTSTFSDTYTVNNLLYASSANTVAGLATGNSSVLVTSGAGVPSLSTDLPTAVTIGTAYIYRVGGTDVDLADGGTGASLSGVQGAVAYSGAAALALSAAGTAGQALVSGGTGSPTWYAPTATRILYAGTSGVLADDANLTWAANALGVGGTAPVITITDTTALAKSLKLAVDGNVASFYEAAGATGSLLDLDLANNRVGVGKVPTTTLDVGGNVLVTGANSAFGRTASLSSSTAFKVGSGSTSDYDLTTAAGTGGRYGVVIYPTIQQTTQDNDDEFYGLYARLNAYGDSSSRNVASGYSAFIGNVTKGSNITFTSAYGLRIASITAGTTSNYGLFVGAPSGGATTNIGIYNAGTLSQVGTATFATSLVLTGQTTTVGAAAGTLANAPTAGDPAVWLRISVNGTTYAFPGWAIP